MKILISFLAILFYFFQKIKNSFKPRKKSVFTERKEVRKNESIISHYQLLDELQANIGKEVIIQSKDLNHLYQNQIRDANNDVRGKIIEVDDDWIILELHRAHLQHGRSADYLYFKTKVIVDFTIVED